MRLLSQLLLQQVHTFRKGAAAAHSVRMVACQGDVIIAYKLVICFLSEVHGNVGKLTDKL